MKDYYKILGVTPESNEEEIRRSYRKLAMQYHPDRNPDNPNAEEKFKEIAEAYGVLTDPVKRREYNNCRATGARYTGSRTNGGFSYSQEDILKDLFKDPRFQQMFTSLLKDFQRSGFRYSSRFISKSFFGGRGSMLLGTIFFLGSLAGPLLGGAAKKNLPGSSSILKNLGNKVTQALTRGKTTRPPQASRAPESASKELDITYQTPLSEEELRNGKSIQILVYNEQGQEQTLKVKIPAGSRNGQKLRIRGRGKTGPAGRGDLYLHLIMKQ